MLPSDALRLASSQHGLLTRHQLAALGVGQRRVHRALARGELEAVTPRVVRVGGTPPSDVGSLCAAVLDAGSGATASGESAAAMWGIAGFRLVPAHVSHPRGGLHRRRTAAVLHTSCRLPPHHVCVLEGVPLTSPARTVFDLAARHRPERVERALDALLARRLATVGELDAMLDELGRRGRPGIRSLRELLAARRADARPVESGLERRFEQLLRDDGQAPMERQVDLGDDTGWLARVDFVDRAARIALFVDGDRFHTALSDRRHDRAQCDALERSGWIVLVAREWDLWHEPRRVLADVRAARLIRQRTAS